jgi:hypothetical protein
MPPKKRPVRELPAEDLSQAARSQDLTTAEASTLAAHIPQTTHPHTSTKSHAAAVDARRPEGLTRQPSTQVEACAINTFAPNLPHRHHSNISATIKTYITWLKPKEMCSKISRKKSTLSSKPSWRAFAKKMNVFTWYKSTWLDKGHSWRELKSCNNRLSKKEQRKQSCNKP